MNGRNTALLITGGVTFLAARFLWDARASAALVWAVLIGGLGYWLASMKPGKLSSVDLTPEV
jgi:hypothetical protein